MKNSFGIIFYEYFIISNIAKIYKVADYHLFPHYHYKFIDLIHEGYMQNVPPMRLVDDIVKFEDRFGKTILSYEKAKIKTENQKRC